VPARRVGRVGIKLEQVERLRLVAGILPVAVAQGVGHSWEVEASEASTGTVPHPTVVRISAVEARSRCVYGQDPVGLGVQLYSILAPPIVREGLYDVHVRCKVELETVVLFHAIFQVIGASRYVICYAT